MQGGKIGTLVKLDLFSVRRQAEREGRVLALDRKKPALGKDLQTHRRAQKRLRADHFRAQMPQQRQHGLADAVRSDLTLQNAPRAHELVTRGERSCRVARGERAAANQLAAEGKRLILAPAGVERGAQVDELELDGALGAELVHLQIERRVHAHARAHAALVGGDGEENAVEIHAAFL